MLLLTLIMILGLPGPACNRPNSGVYENVEESGPPPSAKDPASAGIPDLTSASCDSGLNVEQIVQVLEDNGWDREAAQKVAELNLRYFKILHETDPAEYKGQLATLCRLGSPQYRFAVQSVLIQCPELAGLLAASAQVAADGPQQIANSIIRWDIHKQPDLLGLYMLHGVADDAVKLAKLLNEEGELILLLDERGAWIAVDFLAN
ncbi:MAG: hypothetical protein ACUVQG_15030 [Thermogutta sp.]